MADIDLIIVWVDSSAKSAVKSVFPSAKSRFLVSLWYVMYRPIIC